jgi:hypothetical protein
MDANSPLPTPPLGIVPSAICEDTTGLGPETVRRQVTSSNWQVVDTSFECRVIGPDQFRRTNGDLILVECFDIVRVRAGTLQPKPIAAGSKILVGKWDIPAR